TWYLKKKGEDKDIEDYKVRASRLIVNNDFEYDKESYSSDSDDDGYKAYLGGQDQLGKNTHCFIHDVKSGNEYELSSCSHLFPEAPGHTTGDNNFGKDEEKYWHTNPNDPDTADLGNMDEANIAGLGLDSFSWIYEEGDEVGVVVEGISVEPTQEKDSSYRIMWALPKNKCEVTGKSSANDADGVKTFTSSMRASDINDCLESNFINPAEGGGEAEKLSVSLSYVPEYPMNDPSSENDGDKIVVQSTVTNTFNKDFLNYSWQVYSSDEANPESWGSPMLKSELPESTQTNGIGLDEFSFRLNFESPEKYFKVKLTVTENVSEGTTRQAHNSVVIPISSASEQIRTYLPVVSDDLKMSLGTNEICKEGIEKNLCYVAKNEIIGMKVDKSLADFSWTINGENFSYKECFFDGCNESKQTNVAYFPVLEDVGSRYTVTLNATDQKTGEKISLNKIFEVTDPEIKIASADESAVKPVLLGHYIDLDGTYWPDYSDDNFESLAETDLSFKALSNLNLPSDIIWYIDGVEMTLENADLFEFVRGDDGIVSFPYYREIGDQPYSISVSSLYTQSNNIKKALQKYWDVDYGDFYEKEISDTIEVKVVGSLANTQGAQNSDKKIIASIFSATPSYIAFLLKIVITTFLMLLFSKFILSFFPNVKENEI
ncbi:MAG TPA: hypothetical protein PLK35_04010, partial [Candidatus Moranbacteria bacterium]|nr:hypothetical protein [Candidatus Moranbacteria bacterium]